MGIQMIRGILNAIASVVHHAYQAERIDVSFFVLGDDDGDKQADEYAPTLGWAAVSMETKCEASLI